MSEGLLGLSNLPVLLEEILSPRSLKLQASLTFGGSVSGLVKSKPIRIPGRGIGNQADGDVRQTDGQAHLLLGFPDRRLKMRFPVVVPLRFRVLMANLHYGAFHMGQTVDFGSQGFLVSTEETIPMIGSRILARVHWPVALDGKLPLQFVVTGRVVRIAGRSFGVCFEKHQLHTVRRLAASQMEPLDGYEGRGAQGSSARGSYGGTSA